MEIKEELNRISSAPWFDAIRTLDVDIIGLGGIGSHLAFNISRLGVNSIYLFDGDIIEQVNMAGQLYSKNDIGLMKSNSIDAFIANYSNFKDTNIYGHFDFNNYPMHEIVLCGFDSMTARKEAFNCWKNYNYNPNTNTLNSNNCIFIDGRLAAESFQIFCITSPDQFITYEDEYLFSDDEGDEVVCSYKQTTYSASMIAAVMTNILINNTYNVLKHAKFRAVPFLTTYEGEFMSLTKTVI